MSISRICGLLGRLLKGENIFIAKRTDAEWNAQYRKGKWDYLVGGIPPNAKRLAEIIKASPLPRRILDVGCGNGGLYFALKEKGVVVEYVGVDYSSEAILQAEEKFPEATFFIGDATLPKEEWGREFSIIVFNEVLYYVPMKNTLSKYGRLLFSQGSMLVSMYVSWRTRTLSLLARIFMGFRLETVISPERGYPGFVILIRP